MRVVGLLGFAGEGKSEVAEVMAHFGWREFAFADPLKEVARILGWSGRKDPEGRAFLQNLGDVMRDSYGPDVWIDVTRRLMEGCDSPDVVLSDVRRLNEIAWVKGLGGELWRVDRPGVGPANDHVTEVEWLQVEPDLVIDNDGSLPDLIDKVVTLCVDRA